MPRPFQFCPRCGTALTERLVAGDEQPRRACPASDCRFVHYRNPTPVAAVIVETPEGVILARNTKWPRGMLSLITGFVESGEHPEQTTIRETAEELGLEAHDPTLVGIYRFDPLDQLLMVYHVRAEGEVTLGAELAEYKVVPVAKLKPWSIGPGPGVRDWLAQRRGDVG